METVQRLRKVQQSLNVLYFLPPTHMEFTPGVSTRLPDDRQTIAAFEDGDLKLKVEDLFRGSAVAVTVHARLDSRSEWFQIGTLPYSGIENLIGLLKSVKQVRV